MNFIASLIVTGKVTTIRKANTRYVGTIGMKIHSHPSKLRLS